MGDGFDLTREESIRVTNDPQLTVRTETTEHATVVHVTGEIDLATSLDLGRAFAGLEHSTPSAVPLVIDTTEVSFLSSAGLALLVDLNQRCTAAGVELRIASGNRTVRRALTMTGLTEVLTVVDTLTDALRQQS